MEYQSSTLGQKKLEVESIDFGSSVPLVQNVRYVPVAKDQVVPPAFP